MVIRLSSVQHISLVLLSIDLNITIILRIKYLFDLYFGYIFMFSVQQNDPAMKFAIDRGHRSCVKMFKDVTGIYTVIINKHVIFLYLHSYQM